MLHARTENGGAAVEAGRGQGREEAGAPEKEGIVTMRYRSACFCPCHRSNGHIMHVVPCCQPDRGDRFFSTPVRLAAVHVQGKLLSVTILLAPAPERAIEQLIGHLTKDGKSAGVIVRFGDDLQEVIPGCSEVLADTIVDTEFPWWP